MDTQKIKAQNNFSDAYRPLTKNDGVLIQREPQVK